MRKKTKKIQRETHVTKKQKLSYKEKNKQDTRKKIKCKHPPFLPNRNKIEGINRLFLSSSNVEKKSKIIKIKVNAIKVKRIIDKQPPFPITKQKQNNRKGKGYKRKRRETRYKGRETRYKGRKGNKMEGKKGKQDT